MAGRFSVTNLFNGITSAVARATGNIVNDIWNRIKEYLLPVIRILALLKQFYDAFRKEIRAISNFLEKIPGRIQKLIDRQLNNLGKQIGKLPNDFQSRLFKFQRNLDAGFRKIISPFQKSVQTEFNKATNNIVKFRRSVDDVGKNVNKAVKDIGNIPKKAATEATKTVGDQLPKLLKRSQTAVIEIIEASTKKVPVFKSVVNTAKNLDELIKPLAKNASTLSTILKQSSSTLGSAGTIIKGIGNGSKSVVRALPFLGGLIEALDWEYFKGEFKALFKQVDLLEVRIDELWQQNLKERGTQLAQQKQISNIERIVTQLNRQTPSTGGVGSQSVLSQADISNIANAVISRLPKSNNVSSTDISNAVVNSLSNQLRQSTSVDYGRIETAINRGIASIKLPQQQQQNNTEVLAAINGLKPLFPKTVDIVSGINGGISGAVQVATKNDFDRISNQVTSVNQLLQTVNNSVTSNTTTINKISNTTNNTGITLSNLLQTEAKLTSEIRAVRSTPVNTSNLADKNDVNNLISRLNSLNLNPRITVNPTPVTVNTVPPIISTQVVSPVDYSRINQHTTQTVRDEVAKIPKNQSDPAAEVASIFAQKTYNLLGGKSLEDGLNWNYENEIKSQGVKQYQNQSNLVNTIPALMMAAAAPVFMRGGLHRFPSTMASDVNNPNAAATTINDAVGLQKHYHGLIEQRLGSPVPIRVRGTDGEITVSASRNISEGLDTLTAQNMASAEELAMVQQAVIKLAADQAAMSQIMLVDHDILESLRDFCGYRYTEEKRTKPLEFGLGKESMLDFLTGNTLHYVGTKFDGKMDLTEMLQKLYLEIGKVSASTFSRFDAANPNAKLPIENTSPNDKNADDDEWLRFVKLVNETPSALKDNTDIKAIVRRYTNNDTTVINTSAVQLPQG